MRILFNLASRASGFQDFHHPGTFLFCFKDMLLGPFDAPTALGPLALLSPRHGFGLRTDGPRPRPAARRSPWVTKSGGKLMKLYLNS